MNWVDHAFTVLTGGRENHCEAGHFTHALKRKRISLHGTTAVPDYPPFAEKYGIDFDLYVFDAALYANTQGYCTGDEEVSRSIDAQGVWEGFETLLTLDLLSVRPEGVVVDIGCNVGWYTILAATRGHQVLAVDADFENVAATWRSVTDNGLDHLVTLTRGWVSSKKGQVSDRDVPDIAVMKIDIEGMEPEAIEVFWPAIAADKVHAILMEVSPNFSSYGAVMKRFTATGWMMSPIPDKGFDVAAFAANPIGCSLARLGNPSDVAQSLTQQTNVILVPPG